ncbi:MAG: isochorismatase family protein, partial [Alphaproteobacteria bacterium]
LAGYLKERGVARVFLAGLAADVCVFFSAMDARAAGFETVFVTDATRGVDRDGSNARARADMAAAGILLAESALLLG